MHQRFRRARRQVWVSCVDLITPSPSPVLSRSLPFGARQSGCPGVAVGQFRPSRPLSAAREIGVKCSRKLPTGRAAVLSINGGVIAHGGRVSRNSIQMRAERSRYHQHMPVWENIMNRRIALRLMGAVAEAGRRTAWPSRSPIATRAAAPFSTPWAGGRCRRGEQNSKRPDPSPIRSGLG
jgi:hypothetical protein